MGETTLVTGADGTIGTALCDRIDPEFQIDKTSRFNDNVTETDIRERDLPTADRIIHLANNARVFESVKNPQLAYENRRIDQVVLEHARDTSANLVYASSREVYGGNSTMNTPEWRDKEAKSPYAAAKLATERMIESYRNCYEMNITILRLSNVYGRYDLSDRVVPAFIRQALNDDPLVIFGDKVLDFTFVSDVVDAILKLSGKNGTFNVCSNIGTSLHDLAELIVHKTDSDSEIRKNVSKTGEVHYYTGDITCAANVGWTPTTNLTDGLNANIKWIRKELKK